MEEPLLSHPTSSPSGRVFSLRIVTLDYYMAPPVPELDACYSSFQGQPISEVPVVRVFGTTISGEKICLHLHKAFPYLYVPYDDDLPQNIASASGFARSLASAIEKALKLGNTIAAKRQHVYSCSIVRGKKFYGFHNEEQLFLKIILYYPQEVLRVSTLLLGGGILNRQFQPHESHIPFLLQIMIDYNLAGMGHMHLSEIKFRSPILKNKFTQLPGSGVLHTIEKLVMPNKSLIDNSQNLSSISMELWCETSEEYQEFQGTSLLRQSTCELEGDTSVEAILNRKDLLYIPLEKASADLKMVPSLIPIWEELDYSTTVDNPRECSYNRCIQDQQQYYKDFRRILETILVINKKSSFSKDEMEIHEDDSSDDAASCMNKTALLSHTQAAHSKHQSQLDGDRFKCNYVKDEDDILLNEDMVKHQLSQSSQDTDNEALDLLRWMMNSQQEDANIGYMSDNEKEDDETSWSQVFQCADEALARALSDYEISSQQECQAIIECSEEDLEASCVEKCSPGRKTRMPQMDGSCDDVDAEIVTEINLEEQCPTSTNKIRRSSDIYSFMNDQGECESTTKHQRQFNIEINTSSSGSEGISCLQESLFVDMEKQSLRSLMRRKRMKRNLAQSLSLGESPTGKEINYSSLVTEHPNDRENSYNIQRFQDIHRRQKHDSSRKKGSSDGPLRFRPLPLVKTSVTCGSSSPNVGECNSFSETNAVRSDIFKTDNSHGDDAFITCTGSVNTNSSKDSDLDTVPGQTVCNEDSESVALEFFKKPPSAKHILSTFRDYNLPLANHGRVFYGKQEDLPSQPSVMAGMVFEVISKQVGALLPYQFVNGMDSECSSRAYTSIKSWVPSMNDHSVLLPSHYQNDGTCLFLLSPVKLPPTVHDVYHWLEQCKGEQENAEAYDQTAINSQSSAGAESASQSSLNLTPSSPKYAEAREMPAFPCCNDTSKGLSCRRSSNFSSGSRVHDQDLQPRNLTSTAEKQVSAANQKTSGGEDISQISGPFAENVSTPTSQIGFKDPASAGRGQQVTVMSVEAFARTRGDLRPDPRYDAISCIIIVVQNDTNDQLYTTILVHDEACGESRRNIDSLISCEVILMKEEIVLLQAFIWLVRIYDPDVIVGWEIQGLSLGLLSERAANLGVGLLREISRLPNVKTGVHAVEKVADGETGCNMLAAHIETNLVEGSIIDDEWGRTHGSGIHVSGRIILNLWRVLRGEIKLGIYSLEAVAEAVLKRKVPLISWYTLTSWFSSGPGRKRHLCIEYFMDRAKLNLQIMNQLDLINRTSELARIFGIDFYSVLSRGSQFRVESMMFRLAHSQNYVMVSPSKQQVASQPAMQCLPLVLEPESRLYTDPVVVLDFQSLYPSMMIAYNLCYSTCLGKVIPGNPKILGVSSLNLESKMLKNLIDNITFTPNGVMFVSSKLRPGILPRLLEEILSTRIMVKQSMKKLLSNEKVLQRVLNARQLALKLISNVTYGYTAAGFSGRMPCAELADSIVQCGRNTLETAINFVNNNREWDAQVVYGDTDSIFVLLKGRSREQAFRIGEEIATAITALNPHPVTLKMEKVYHPCVLLTKKRYAGYSYENPKQVSPKFDAKGIETVRRDSCGAVAKILERSMRIIFETQDISQVKTYVQRQWGKILTGRICIKDFIFAKEVRLGTYSAKSSVLPPAAIVASKALSQDPRAEPRYGERIPYVVVHGEPGSRLVDMVVDPYAMLMENSPFRLHDTYYITKQIVPALQRIFNLVGVDINLWYSEMPRQFRRPITRSHMVSKTKKYGALHDLDTGHSKCSKRTIDHYYLSKHCVVCGELIQASTVLCEVCSRNQMVAGISILGKSSRLEKELKHIQAICKHCGGGDEKDIEEGLGCISLACNVFFERIKLQKEFRTASAVNSWTDLK